MYSFSIFHFYFSNTKPTTFYLFLNLQVKIKRKQLLVRKGVEPISSFDWMKNAPTAKGTTFGFLFVR
jgi:hypothetical protein